MHEKLPDTNGYPRTAIAINGAVAVAVTAAVIWAANGFAVFYEGLFRVSPSVEGGGIGTDWIVGNQIAWLDFAVALIHAADVLMGLFILFMVFLHWAAFRRLAARMRGADSGTDRSGVAADGGRVDGGESTDRATDGEEASDGGEPTDRTTDGGESVGRGADADDGGDR